MSNPLNPILFSQPGPDERISLCCHRTFVYRMGMLSLCICFIFCVISCSSSNWIKTRHFEDEEDHEENLYLTHDGSFIGILTDTCNAKGNHCTNGFMVSQLLLSHYLGGYFVIFGIALFENLRKVNPRSYHSRKLEISVLILGILGTLSMIVFIIQYSTRLGWSMALASISVVGLYVTCSFLIFGNKKHVPIGGQPGAVLFTSIPNPNSAVVQSYGPGTQQVYQTHYMAQTQPLLPAQTMHPLSPAGAPPPYSLPPPYPASFTPNAPPSYNYNLQNVPQPLPQHHAPFYPQQNTQPNRHFEKFSQASAPPSEEAP